MPTHTSMGFSQATEDCGGTLGGVPMMVVSDDDGNLTPRSALGFFASELAPTGARKNKTPTCMRR